MKRLLLIATFTFFISWVYSQGTQVGDANSPIYHYNGNVGISEQNPQFGIDVVKAASSQELLFRARISDSASDYFKIFNATGVSGQFIPALMAFHNSDSRNCLSLIATTDAQHDNSANPLMVIDSRLSDNGGIVQNRPLFGWNSFGNSRMTMLANGNVGIGTTIPDYKLDVLGTIRANEVKVATGWSDFVFEPEYDLPTLQEVENYIDQNGHLPDIPSAKEVETNGMSLGDMDAKLLQKIEELTLYVLDHQKKFEEQQRELLELKKKNTQLIQRINQLENE